MGARRRTSIRATPTSTREFMQTSPLDEGTLAEAEPNNLSLQVVLLQQLVEVAGKDAQPARVVFERVQRRVHRRSGSEEILPIGAARGDHLVLVFEEHPAQHPALLP